MYGKMVTMGGGNIVTEQKTVNLVYVYSMSLSDKEKHLIEMIRVTECAHFTVLATGLPNDNELKYSMSVTQKERHLVNLIRAEVCENIEIYVQNAIPLQAVRTININKFGIGTIRESIKI
jgi:hypothetical protein